MEKTCPHPAIRDRLARPASWPSRLILALCLTGAMPGPAAESDSGPSLAPPPIPELGESFFRVFGALTIVLAVFLAGVWLFRNWQRLPIARNPRSQLRILEGKSLGNRQALFVVGYRNQRLMIGTSAAGIALITHLPEEEPGEAEEAAALPPPKSFASLLNRGTGSLQ